MNVPVPGWLIDDYLLSGRLSRAAMAATLALFSAGTVQEDDVTNTPCVYRKWTREQWAKRAGCAPRQIAEAIFQLVNAGILAVHPSKKVNEADGYRIPLERPRSAVSADLVRRFPHDGQIPRSAVSAPHDHDDDDLSTLSDRSLVSSLNQIQYSRSDQIIIITRAELFASLEALGVDNADALIARFGAELVASEVHAFWDALPPPRCRYGDHGPTADGQRMEPTGEDCERWECRLEASIWERPAAGFVAALKQAKAKADRLAARR